jgi:thymidylate synthase ThyX
MAFKAEIVADSLNLQGDRITSMLLTYPRIIHAELLTHRMFSRNAASSRAIPFKKMVKDVQENPFIPIAWQKPHSGMQGTEYITDPVSIQVEIDEHLSDRDEAIRRASARYERGVTKQICNRYLEPFQYITVLVTATEWDNFLKLRCPEYSLPVANYGSYRSWKDLIKDISYPEVKEASQLFKLKNNKSQAEIHIQHLAELIWDARNESTPKQLKEGEWHIPFGDKLDNNTIWNIPNLPTLAVGKSIDKSIGEARLKIATARCARLSYTTLGAEPKIDYAADIRLHDMLLESEHFSPFEHCAKAMSDEEYGLNTVTTTVDDKSITTSGWCRNFRGFIQYRHLISK